MSTLILLKSNTTQKEDEEHPRVRLEWGGINVHLSKTNNKTK